MPLAETSFYRYRWKQVSTDIGGSRFRQISVETGFDRHRWKQVSTDIGGTGL
jgi:hypothetical protein